MQNLITALRSIIGTPDFYHSMSGATNYQWDYGRMMEYMVASMIVMIVVANVFKFIRWLFSK